MVSTNNPTITFTAGHRVRFVGVSGTKDGPIGTVSMVVKSGVLIRWDHDRSVRELVHPESLRLLTAPATSYHWTGAR